MKALKCDCVAGDAFIAENVTLPSTWYIQVDLGVPTSTLAALQAATDYGTANLINIALSGGDDAFWLGDFSTSASLNSPTTVGLNNEPGHPHYTAEFPADQFNTIAIHYDGTNIHWSVNGVAMTSYAETIATGVHDISFGGAAFSNHVAGEVYYVTGVKMGTTLGGVELFNGDLTGGTGAWSPGPDGATSLVEDPFDPTGPGRVLIAFNDGPLVADPTWTQIDDNNVFPANFVSGYDITTGRQTLLAQTDTGTATVYINDYKEALFDPRNVSSPYFGKLDGRQIALQLYDPVRAVWELQFRGLIDEVTYDIDGSAADHAGDPINASIQINCVDVFDYLNGYGLTPGLDGVAPPAGAEDGVYYAQTTSFVDDRIIEILADVGLDSSRYVVFSGNVSAQAVKYDPDSSALSALRDASDAEFPFIANMYVDRFGRFCWHGRYGRFDPSGVSSDAGTARWDWHDWKLGDGKAYNADSTRTQIRILSYLQARNNIVNVAVAYPANMLPKQMPFQVFGDTASIGSYGKFSAPPLSDLLVQEYIGPGTAISGTAECLLYAELLVKNQKDPRVSVSAVELRSINPSDPKGPNVWACLTQCDISDLVNIKVGYPSGTGLAGSSPTDDYFVEGRRMTVRPANTAYDDVTLDLELSPFVWSADTHSVFPARA
jgi:hypothetical protein